MTFCSPPVTISTLRNSPSASQSALEAVNFQALADFMHWPHSEYTDMHIRVSPDMLPLFVSCLAIR